MFGVDPITIGVGTLIWLAFRKQTNTQFGVLTAAREEVYRNAMAHCADPDKLNKLAGVFQTEGLKTEAYMLRKRAEWRGRSEAQRKVHADIFAKAMVSKNVPAILQVAAAFDEMTATIKAGHLRARAQELNEAALKSAEPASKPVEKPAEAKPAEVKPVVNGSGGAGIPGNTEPKASGFNRSA